MSNRASLMLVVMSLLFAGTGCSTISGFEWLSLASLSRDELAQTPAEDVNIYYYSSDQIEGSINLVAHAKTWARAEILEARVVESTEVIHASWMGDEKCYVYRLVLSPAGLEQLQLIQQNWEGEIDIRAPRAQSGVAWLLGRESEVVITSAPMSLDEWLEQ